MTAAPVVYPLQARVWFRESTQEWVLDLEGVINDTHMNCRHTQPLQVLVEDVPGLPLLYEDVRVLEAENERLRKMAREAEAILYDHDSHDKRALEWVTAYRASQEDNTDD